MTPRRRIEPVELPTLTEPIQADQPEAVADSVQKIAVETAALVNGSLQKHTPEERARREKGAGFLARV